MDHAFLPFWDLLIILQNSNLQYWTEIVLIGKSPNTGENLYQAQNYKVMSIDMNSVRQYVKAVNMSHTSCWG